MSTPPPKARGPWGSNFLFLCCQVPGHLLPHPDLASPFFGLLLSVVFPPLPAHHLGLQRPGPQTRQQPLVVLLKCFHVALDGLSSRVCFRGAIVQPGRTSAPVFSSVSGRRWSGSLCGRSSVPVTRCRVDLAFILYHLIWFGMGRVEMS